MFRERTRVEISNDATFGIFPIVHLIIVIVRLFVTSK
jgi:hypothetical protein